MVAALGVATATLLVAGLLAAVAVGRPGDRSDGLDREEAAGLQALVPELERFVERARGLAFKAPVKVTLLGDADFRARLAEANRRTDDDLQDVAAADEVLTALGLLAAHVDLAEAVDGLLGSSVAGFYDPRTDELVVRGEEPTPAVRVTLVHELTHALQDQHFELHRPDLAERDDEAADAFGALVEGDAVRIEEQYLASLPAGEARAVAAEERRAAGRIGGDAPPVLLQLLGFPYAAGPAFVAEVDRSGGQAALDAAFASPPVTSEHVLHPETFLGGEPPAPVEAPAAGAEVVDAGVLGELGLLLVLAQELTRPEAAAAARGWGGDRYVAWRRGASSCVRASVVMDTPADTAQLVAALSAWAARSPGGAEVERATGTAPVRFTACG